MTPPSPALSVVVAIVSDTMDERANVDLAGECLDALFDQVDAPPTEVIVPYHEKIDGIDDLRRRFPEAVYVLVDDPVVSARKAGSREHHDVIRAHGIARATGEVVGLLEDHGRPDAHWCANTVAAHRSDYAAIGGAIENGIDRPLNWAVYFCDFGKYQNPVPEGDSTLASDANTSYKRAALSSVRSTWEKKFNEIIVNGELLSQGRKIGLRRDIVVHQNRKGLRAGKALRERYVWGRSYAASRNALLSLPKRLIHAVLSPVLPVLLTLRMADTVRQRGRHVGAFLRSLPFVLLLLVSWSFGEAMGYLAGVGSEGGSDGRDVRA